MEEEILCDCDIVHNKAVNTALNNQVAEANLTELSELFKMLGDLTRIKIIWSLDNRELCVCDIAKVLNMTKSAISHQLAILRHAGIVKYRRDGKEVYYTLDDEHITKLYEIGLEHIDHRMRGIK
ncbi:MAG: metalloregulator ArsR/SmtB family transcription factor [bacterium]|nr:metalloregulator ArsR/SmtB family transcription factor [bacterium]